MSDHESVPNPVPTAESSPAAPAASPPPQAEPASVPAPGTKPPRNVLALVALIVSIVGFIFACIPGALIVGWIALPIAFVLAIVSLFMKGRGKGLGIAGLIISIVGTIVGFIVFFFVVANSLSTAFSDQTTVVPNAPTAEQPAAEQPAAEAGTRDNPVPLGSEIKTDDWTVVVTAYNPDGNEIVASANSFNAPPEPGSHYEIVTYTVTYTGDDSSLVAEVLVDVVTNSGNVIDSFEHFVVLEDAITSNELFNGGSATGSRAFLVPDGETVLIRVQPGLFADEIFVAP